MGSRSRYPELILIKKEFTSLFYFIFYSLSYFICVNLGIRMTITKMVVEVGHDNVPKHGPEYEMCVCVCISNDVTYCSGLN